jgi:hypothetical protein
MRKKQEYIDLDKLIEIEKVLNIANDDYEKEWRDDDDYTD